MPARKDNIFPSTTGDRIMETQLFIRDQAQADNALMHEAFQDWMWIECIRFTDGLPALPDLWDVDAAQCGI
jgi:hypothetical protein